MRIYSSRAVALIPNQSPRADSAVRAGARIFFLGRAADQSGACRGFLPPAGALLKLGLGLPLAGALLKLGLGLPLAGALLKSLILCS